MKLDRHAAKWLRPIGGKHYRARGGSTLGGFPLSLRVAAPALLLVALLAPVVASQAPAPWAPLAASAVAIQGAEAAVSWLPGSESADSYRVYGVTSDGSLTLLAPNVTDLSATVPTGFAEYAVSGVKLGVESAPVLAIQEDCIIISTDPPNVSLFCPSGATTAEVWAAILS